MKKLITVFLLLICVSISFSQSKKQQIETLTYKLDSINSVLLRSIDDNEKLSDTKLVLESKVSLLKNENSSKDSKISLLKNENASKNGEISLKNEKIASLTKEVKSLEQDYQLVVADHNSKADSAEIFKLKKERIIEVNSYYLKIGFFRINYFLNVFH
jgi:chromosome segregation ATPase